MDWGNVFSQALTQGIGIQAVIFALAAIGLNVQFGYTGLLNFGQSGFLAVAAYGLGVSIAFAGLSLWVGIAVGILATVLQYLQTIVEQLIDGRGGDDANDSAHSLGSVVELLQVVWLRRLRGVALR